MTPNNRICALLLLVFLGWNSSESEAKISVISEESGNIVRVIEDRNIRATSEELEGYVVNANPPNVCQPPSPPPSVAEEKLFGKRNASLKRYKNFILLGIIYDCDLTTKARNAQKSGYSGLIIQNIGTNDSSLLPWRIMRFPLAQINHVVVGEFDGFLLRYNYSYPYNSFFIRFEEDSFYQVLCYVLAAIVLVLIMGMFIIFWFQVCCTLLSRRLQIAICEQVQNWLHPGKRRLTKTMLRLLPTKNWSQSDPFQVCAVCQEDFLENDKIRILPCSHGFHSICIDPWLLRRSRRCPICMQRIKLPQERDDHEDVSVGSDHPPATSPRSCSFSTTYANDISRFASAQPSSVHDFMPLIDFPQASDSKSSLPQLLPKEKALDLPAKTVHIYSQSLTVENLKKSRDRFSSLQNVQLVQKHTEFSSKSCSLLFHPVDPKCKLTRTETQIKLSCINKTRTTENILLETCVDGPPYSFRNSFSTNDIGPSSASGSNDSSNDEITPLQISENIKFIDDIQVDSERECNFSTVGGKEQLVSSGRENGDTSEDDDATDDNITLSCDATTVSESLPCDDEARLDDEYDTDSLDTMSGIFHDTDIMSPINGQDLEAICAGMIEEMV